MSFLGVDPPKVDLEVLRGFSFGPRTFLKRHGASYDPPYESFENDGFEVHLEVSCTSGGEKVLELDSTDEDSGLSIDGDEILISLELSPAQTADLDFECCNYVMFIYKGTLESETVKDPIVYGEFRVKDLG